ncbi:hypothetical protein [Azonexus sp.]|uniref:hypothetical protein n=1 Tax=Azonexus sp. TaxID=1872668 RepID=UPI0027B8A5E4|nr:hypothetical protein [Azonexus sp.]
MNKTLTVFTGANTLPTQDRPRRDRLVGGSQKTLRFRRKNSLRTTVTQLQSRYRGFIFGAYLKLESGMTLFKISNAILR